MAFLLAWSFLYLVDVALRMLLYAERECMGAGASIAPVAIFAEARRMTSSSAGAKSSGGIPPTATCPGSSPRAIEIWFQRRNGEVVGRVMMRRFGSGNAKYADQVSRVNPTTNPFTRLIVEYMFGLCESHAELMRLAV